MNFDGVKSITIPEGKVVKITSGGVVLWKAKPKYTNQIPTSLDTDEKTIYNGTGYALNTRLGSDGTIRTGVTNCVTSGLIPYNGKTVELTIPTTSPNSNAYLHVYVLYKGEIKADVPFTLPNGTSIDGSHRQIPFWVSEWGVASKVNGSTTVLTIPAETIANASDSGDVLYLRVSSNMTSGISIDDSTFCLKLID